LKDENKFNEDDKELPKINNMQKLLDFYSKTKNNMEKNMSKLSNLNYDAKKSDLDSILKYSKKAIEESKKNPLNEDVPNKHTNKQSTNSENYEQNTNNNKTTPKNDSDNKTN